MSFFNHLECKVISVLGQSAGDQYVAAFHNPVGFSYSGVYTVEITNGVDTYQFDLSITGSTNPSFNAVSCKIINIMATAGVGISDSVTDFNSNFDFSIVDNGSGLNFVIMKFLNAGFLGGNFDMRITNKMRNGEQWTSLIDYLGKDYSTVSGYPFSNNTLLSPLSSLGGGTPTLTAPTITTSAATSITTSGMTLNANLSALGSETAVDVKFIYSVNSGASVTVTASSGANTSTLGNYSYSLTGLSSGDSVTFQAVAIGKTNAGNDGAGTNLSATTSSLTAPSVTTSAASSVLSTTMTLNGNLTSLGSEASVNVGFDYRLTGAPTFTRTSLTNKTSTGTFSVALTGLTVGATYEFKAVAIGQTNAGNDGAGSLLNQTMSSPTADADSVINITGSTSGASNDALDSTNVPSVTNGSIVSNTIVASANNSVATTKEYSQQGGDPDFTAIQHFVYLKPKKYTVDPASNSSSIVVTDPATGQIVNNDKLWVNDGGTMKQLQVGSVSETSSNNSNAAWTLNGTFFPDNPVAVAYGNGLWVAIFANGGSGFLTSTNGTSWSSGSYSATGSMFAVTYGNGLWVAVGANGQILTSTNGTSWTGRTSNAGTEDLRSVAYGNGLWVAVGGDAAPGVITTSTDGINWTRRSDPGQIMYGVAYGNGLWVAVGAGGLLLTSPDGINWTAQTSGFSTYDIFSVAYGNGVLVAVGANGKAASSSNGTTWTPRNSNITSGDNLQSVGYGNGLFIAGGQLGKITTSPDGATWTAQTSGFSQNINSLFCGNGLWVAALSGTRIATSGAGFSYKYTCTGLTSTFGSALSAAPTAVYSGNQIFQSSVVASSGSPSYTNDTINTVTVASDVLTINLAQRNAAGRYVQLKETIGNGDVITRLGANMYK